MTAMKYGLTSDEVAWVEDVLSNDDASTDAELLAYFVSNGLRHEQANGALNHRQDYLINIYFTGQGPLNTD